jgi:adenine deaminase
MHVESGMLTVSEFVRAVIPHGTTAMFIDPHEIANVFGLKGVRLMLDEAGIQPIHVWVQIPSCVPSAPGLETPGATITPEDVAEALSWKGIIGLGEVMNFPSVFSSDEKLHAEMTAARLAGKVIGGHYASPDLGNPFHGYVAGGPEDDHEGTRMEDAMARVRQGMKVMLRMGSAWHDVAEGVRAITEGKSDPRHFILCTDDSHSETLVNEGHVNRAIKQAISHGIPPITALQMATLNPAEHFGLARDIGMIAPGRYADILLVRDLANLDPDLVFAKGQLVAEKRQLRINSPEFTYPEWATHSVHLPRKIEPADFQIKVPGKPRVTANVIGIIENQAPTRLLKRQITVENGLVTGDITQDIAKIGLVDRHHGTGSITLGLVHGFGFTEPCAIASTVAHDCHHMLVVGTNDEDMAVAANHLAQIEGGQVVVLRGQIAGEIALPIAGLMSNARADLVAQQAGSVLQGFRLCGCQLNNPNMQLSLLTLVVIPELRISNLGLVDVRRFEFIPLFEES